MVVLRFIGACAVAFWATALAGPAGMLACAVWYTAWRHRPRVRSSVE
jgi:hypothetical protein